MLGTLENRFVGSMHNVWQVPCLGDKQTKQMFNFFFSAIPTIGEITIFSNVIRHVTLAYEMMYSFKVALGIHNHYPGESQMAFVRVIR
jgi:hypothetical protein